MGAYYWSESKKVRPIKMGGEPKSKVEALILVPLLELLLQEII
jgi:hypothetical protein